MILQCRVKPNKIKMASNNIWVINQPQDIRPYGVLLIKNRQNFPNAQQLYGQNQFDWNKMKDKIKI